MENTYFQQKITALLPSLELRLNESMAKHTSFRIGGPAEVVAFPKSSSELAEILKLLAVMLETEKETVGAVRSILVRSIVPP